MESLIIIGLGFGDEGKGGAVDHAVRSTGAHLVVRYSGGAQAAHNVVLPDARHHTFAQFGSGSFSPGVETFLSRYMLVNPGAMLNEGEHLVELGLTDIFSRMVIDREALITNPYQIAANRVLESLRNKDRHGSCGMGIGETMCDALSGNEILVRDLEDPKLLKSKLEHSRKSKYLWLKSLEGFDEAIAREFKNEAFLSEWGLIADPLSVGDVMERYQQFLNSGVRITDGGYLQDRMKEGITVFEGAQGVLLDQDYGFQPYTTWTDTTFGNAEKLLEGFDGTVTKVGVIRSYSTRHGAGPLVTEDPEHTFPEKHNGNHKWAKNFRTGPFDLVMFDYALRVVGGVDSLVITHMDVPQTRICAVYDDYPGSDISTIMNLPVNRPRFPHDPEQFKKQEQLTQALMRAKPGYYSLHSNPELAEQEFIDFIRDRCPVRFHLSYGPTHEDKSA